MVAKLVGPSFLALLLSVSVGVGASAATPGSPAAATSAAQNASTRSNDSTQADASPTAAQLNQSAMVVMPPPILRNTGKITLTPDKPLLGHLNLKSQPVQGLLTEAPPALEPTPYEAALTMNTGNKSSLVGP